MQVLSTRGKMNAIPATQAVLQGIAADGGLFVPQEFPQIDLNEMEAYAAHEYLSLIHIYIITMCERVADHAANIAAIYLRGEFQ